MQPTLARGSRSRFSIGWYFAALVALFVVVSGVTSIQNTLQARSDARADAQRDSAHGAGRAGAAIRAGLDAAARNVERIAATPNIGQVLTAPAACSLAFAGNGPFPSGHVDIVAPDGRVACSSLALDERATYAGAGWLPQALRGGTVGPVTDGRTDRPVAIVAAPLPGGGAATAFLELAALGPALAELYGTGRGLEFLVTDRSTIVTRSLAPERWTGTALAAAAFDADGEAARRDVDGTRRLYADAPVPGIDWVVHAGADEAMALAGADERARHDLLVNSAGFTVLLLAAAVLHRRVARPIGRLAEAVRAGAAHRTPLPDSLTGPREVVSLAEDVRVLMETAERELHTASRLAAIVEASPDAIVSSTLDGTVTTWNPGAERTFGFSAEQMIGRTMNRTVPADRAGERDHLLARVGEGEQITQLDTQRVRADGTVIDVSVSMAPLLGPDGSVIGVSAVTRDVSAQRAAERERRALEQRLLQSERLESLGRLAGGIAHDFNNLLSLIINFAALALEALDPDDPACSYLEEVQRAGLSAARMTKQLLVFGTRDDAHAEPVDLPMVLAEVKELLASSVGERVELRIERGTEPATVSIDRGQFEQILLNLTVNARDAMPDGGVIVIRLGTVHLGGDARPAPPGLPAGPYAELVVRDTGSGMSEDVAAHIFEPFFTTKAPGEGTGLGLATIYGIVTKIGGTIEVHSEVGEGTTFRLYLPSSPAAALGDGGSRPEGPGRGHGETVLVVDDEPAVLDVACHLLRRNGYTVVPAATAAEAMDVVGRDPTVRLLLTDSVIPSPAGGPLADQARRIRPDLRVVFMSGHDEPGRDAGGPGRRRDFLAKPFDEETLLRAVSDAFSR